MTSDHSPHRILFVFAVALLLILGAPQARAAEEETPSELAREGMERMLRAIELMIEMIPQYEMPEVLENGDIIIRRKQSSPDTEEPPEDEEELDQTRT
jgi:hypothetical protein